MTKIILTRHGHVEGINPTRFRGRIDLPLTKLGEAQARATADRIARIWCPKAIYTSPMKRCTATGHYIASACRVESEVLNELNDLDYGAWQWKTHNDIRNKWPALYNAWQVTPHLVQFPGGESLQDLIARTARALRMVLRRHAEETDVVVMVGHDSVNRALLIQMLDQPLSAYRRIVQEPCALNEIDIANDGVRVIRINETQHLEGLAI